MSGPVTACAEDEGGARPAGSGPGTAPSHASVQGTGLYRWLGLALFVLVVFAAPALLLRSWQDGAFDRSALDALNRQQPEIVFIGNSMLETRIDPDHLSQFLNGTEIASLAVPGSQSAVWYLQLKNLVASTEPPPETVFIFFRNDLITQPLAPLDERNRELVASLRSVDETELDAVLDASRSLHQQTLHALEWVYPVQRQNDEVLEAISQVSAALLPSSRDELSSLADDKFAFHNQREQDEDALPPEAAKTFGKSVELSFLPIMLQVADEHEIDLVFVRVQARPNFDGTVRESESMRIYSQDLAAYLEAHDVGYIDFTGNPSVDRGLYYDSFHIRQRYLLDYTELFLRESQRFLPTAGGENSGQGR